MNIKSNMKVALFSAVVLSMSGAAVAKRAVEAGLEQEAASNQTVLVTEAGVGGMNKVAGVDFQSNGDAFAFQFLMNMPKGVMSVDTSDCLSRLPANFAGKCVANTEGSKIAVVVYTTGSEPLPAGMQELGTIRYKSNAKVAGGISIDSILVAAKDGKELGSSAKVVKVD